MKEKKAALDIFSWHYTMAWMISKISDERMNYKLIRQTSTCWQIWIKTKENHLNVMLNVSLIL